MLDAKGPCLVAQFGNLAREIGDLRSHLADGAVEAGLLVGMAHQLAHEHTVFGAQGVAREVALDAEGELFTDAQRPCAESWAPGRL